MTRRASASRKANPMSLQSSMPDAQIQSAYKRHPYGNHANTNTRIQCHKSRSR